MSKLQYEKERFSLGYIKKCFSYNQETGVLCWSAERPREDFKSKESYTRYMRHKVETIAGSPRKVTETLTYQYVNIHKTHIYAHHIIWFIHHGRWPSPMIDHIDGDGLNNRLSNLKECVSKDNQKNTKKYKSNTSGVTGVSWRQDALSYTAYIGQENLGSGLTLFEACCVRKAAEMRYGYSERNGK